MTSFLAAFHLDEPASLKRAIAAALGGLVILLSPLLSKYGLPVPSDTALEMFAAVVSAFLIQSGANSIAGKVAAGKAAGAAAADGVVTPADAAKVLSEPARP